MPKLPTENDLKKLPLRALVAYAARCAKRVQPLFRSGNPEHLEAVDGSIALATSFSQGEKVPDFDVITSLAAIRAADDAANEIASNASGMEAMEAGIVAEAARAALAALTTLLPSDEARAVESAQFAAAAAASAAGSDPRAVAMIIRAADIDYCLLKEMPKDASSEHRGPSDVFFDYGPLWPDGEPEGWPKKVQFEAGIKASATLAPPTLSATATFTPPLTVFLDPGTAPQELITEFYVALASAYRACGGAGLKIVNNETGTLALEGGIS